MKNCTFAFRKKFHSSKFYPQLSYCFKFMPPLYLFTKPLKNLVFKTLLSMKKAKFILSAIGLISLVGGAMAFKAQHKFLGNLKCSTTSTTTNCPIFATTSGSPNAVLFCTLTDALAKCSVSQRVSVDF